jgi:hypothetical protein
MPAPAITPRTSVATTLVVSATVLALVVVYVVGVTPPTAWHAPDIGPRAYSGVVLEEVLQDLEHQGLIPAGTSWQEPVLRRRRVTARWFWIRDTEALELIGQSAGVTFEYPVGHHGEIWGPVRVLNASPLRGGTRAIGRGSLPYRGVR